MRFFHLSDLHIGLKLMNRDLGEDQRFIFREIADYAAAYKPDAIVIAGDIYDKAVPSAEAVELFDDFTAMLMAAAPEAVIMMISGNHDSAARVNVFRNVLARHDLYMIGQPPRREEDRIEQVVLKDAHGDVTFYLLPFVKPSMVKQIVGTAENGNNLSYNETLHRLIARESIDTSGRNVLVSHQFYLPVGRSADEVERMDSEIRTVGNIDEVKADMLEVFDYAALGHIHKPMSVGSSLFRYCGTPLACSVSEAGQEKGIIMVEMGEKGHVETSVLPLKPLHQVRIIEGELKDVLLKPSEDYVTVVLTDKAEIDSVDAIDRLRHAFPNILEIRREKNKAAELADVYRPEKEQSPFELCKAFLGEAQEEDLAIITDIINTISL